MFPKLESNNLVLLLLTIVLLGTLKYLDALSWVINVSLPRKSACSAEFTHLVDIFVVEVSHSF